MTYIMKSNNFQFWTLRTPTWTNLITGYETIQEVYYRLYIENN